MGIDARIVVRIKGGKPTDEQLTRWSWSIGQSIGGRHFFIADGLPAEKYHPAERAWHKAFREHPLYVHWDKAEGEVRRGIHDQIFADIGKCQKQLRRAIELCNVRYPVEDDEDTDIPVEYRKPGKCYIQDGDPILVGDGEWLLEVSLWTRYYGIGYERGDLLVICAVAEWLEQNIPGCVVYYGGDSSGVEAVPFDDAERKKLRAHMYGKDGRDYFNYGNEGRCLSPKPCGLCIPGEPHFSQYGFGSQYTAVSCAGCGKAFVTRDNGATWIDAKEDEKQQERRFAEAPQ